MSGIGGARFRILTHRQPERVPSRLALARTALEILDAHLRGRSYLVGESCSIAEVSIFAYAHVAPEAGLELRRYANVSAWLDRTRNLPGFMNDLAPYPDNAQAGRSRSIYDT